MAGRECYHCKQWVEQGELHDCWTTTEAALTRDLPEDLREAWERLRETAAEFGEQRIYASHHSIMFSRKACYFFVRPKRRFLEVCIFLPRIVKSARIHKVHASAKSKHAHMVRVVHRDEVEPPLTDWIHEAFDFAAPKGTPAKTTKSSRNTASKTRVKTVSTARKKSRAGRGAT